MNPTSARYFITKEKTAWVDMSSPRPCSYQRRTWLKHEPVLIPNSRSTAASSCPPVEFRGIMLTQLRAVMANINRRCMERYWKSWDGDSLTLNCVTIYEIDKSIVRPFTEAVVLSYQEHYVYSKCSLFWWVGHKWMDYGQFILHTHITATTSKVMKRGGRR